MAVKIDNKAESKIPNFRPGDTVRVHIKVVEGDSERIQAFEGVCIRRRGMGVSESFTVRKISFGVGVERILPLQSPRIQKIEIIKAGKARRAKLYYLRELKGKAARIRERTQVKINVPETGKPQEEMIPVAAETPASPSADDSASKVEAAAA